VVLRKSRRATRPESAADAEEIRSAAIALLARRDFASGELRQKLQAKGYEREVVATVLQDLANSRMLDDARFATNYVTYHAGRGRGPIRIAADLRALDVSAELIEAALASGPDWAALALEQRGRRFGLRAAESGVEKARQARFLQYRGFSSDHIRAALGADVDSDLQT
jgi:regulatory protein